MTRVLIRRMYFLTYSHIARSAFFCYTSFMDRVTFEWNEAKNRENQKKHGVSFQIAQYAFADPNRVIAEDLSHSQEERRYYCFGHVGTGIMTVRFTYRENVIRIFGAGYWRRGRQIYEEENKIHG